jgi:H/ACA ribonucleoprotein complex non-core subunit NAF1
LPSFELEPRATSEDQPQETLYRETDESEAQVLDEIPKIEEFSAVDRGVQLSGAEVLDIQASCTDHEERMHAKDEEPQSVTGALEALLGGITPTHIIGSNSCVGSGEENIDNKVMDKPISKVGLDETPTTPYDPLAEPTPAEVEMMALAAKQDLREDESNNISQEAEWEVDSSPIQSEESDASESSSVDDSDEEDTYKLLDPEEQARILMEGDVGSDDEGAGGKGAKGTGGQIKTKNELIEEVVHKPEVTIKEEMKIENLGEVEAVVENIVLIKAKTSGEYRVLESGSVLCLADRSVIGVVSETLGQVLQPRYAVRFTNSEEILEAGLAIGTTVFYSEQHSTYVFTNTLKAYKGSDASNLHDEEVGDEEMEFSDDEAEAEHKKRLKQRKFERRYGKAQPNDGANRGGHPLQHQYSPHPETKYDPRAGISYDDDDDGPYRPLARPAGFAESIGRSEPPQESMVYTGRPHRGGRDGNHFHQSRGGGSRGRGGRPRGVDRSRGKGNFQGRGGFQTRNDEHPQPARSNRSDQRSPMSPNFPPRSQSPQDPYSPLQPQFQPPSHPLMAYNQQPYPYPQSQPPMASPPQQQPSWQSIPMSPGGPTLPTGAYINPAFFSSQMQNPQIGQQWLPPAGFPPPPPPPQQQQQWRQPFQQVLSSPQAERAFQEVQERLNILRNLGGGQGQ